MVPTTVPKTSLAAVIARYGEPIELRELPVPALEPGALLVKIEAATVCGSDVHLWDGSLAAHPIDLPVVPGHEMVGRIVAFGHAAERDSVGAPLNLDDRIVFTHASCGRCHYCLVTRVPSLCKARRYYIYSSCEKHPYLVGGFAEYCYVFPTSGRIKVPDGVPTDWASAASCALRSVVTSFERLGPIEPWQTVLIQGAGPLGLFATAMASHSGAARVIVIGAPDARLELARMYGASDVVSIESVVDEQERASRVSELTDGDGPDIVMEFSGARSAVAEGLAMIRDGGRYVIAGQVGPHSCEIMPTLVTRKQLTLLGSWSGDTSHYWRALRFMRETRDKYDFSRMLGDGYPLDGVEDAFRAMKTGSEMKPVIRPWQKGDQQ